MPKSSASQGKCSTHLTLNRLSKMSDVDIFNKAKELRVQALPSKLQDTLWITKDSKAMTKADKDLLMRRIESATRPPRRTIAKPLEGGCPKIKRIIENKVEMGGGEMIREEVGECDICGHKLKRGLEIDNGEMIGYDCYLNLCGVKRTSGGRVTFKDLPKQAFEDAAQGFVEDLNKLTKDQLIKAATSELSYDQKKGEYYLIQQKVEDVKILSPIDVQFTIVKENQKPKSMHWNALIDRSNLRVVLGLEPHLLEKLIDTQATSKFFQETRNKMNQELMKRESAREAEIVKKLPAESSWEGRLSNLKKVMGKDFDNVERVLPKLSENRKQIYISEIEEAFKIKVPQSKGSLESSRIEIR
jgi:hypothetical protein